MGLILRSFEMPKAVTLDEQTGTANYGKFTAEAFERGFGVTVGNSLRRVLLSSLEGAAVSSIRIEGVNHEFDSIPGVLEEVTEIIMNVKQLVFKSHSRAPKNVSIDVDKKGDLTAADIITDDTLEVVNPDHKIATLTKKVKFKAEFEVTRGRGFVVADANRHDEQPIGTIPIDAIYSPVKRVSIKVEDTRVGQITDYDRLILEIWTDGSVTPKDALLYGANIMQKQIDVFVNLGQLPEDETSETITSTNGDEATYRLDMPVSELELSVRSANCLNEARIKTIGELVSRSESEMMKYRNFGKKSLTEISEILKTMGLDFGMTSSGRQDETLAEAAS